MELAGSAVRRSGVRRAVVLICIVAVLLSGCADTADRVGAGESTSPLPTPTTAGSPHALDDWPLAQPGSDNPWCPADPTALRMYRQLSGDCPVSSDATLLMTPGGRTMLDGNAALSDAAIVGTVTNVSPWRWNSIDGRDWRSQWEQWAEDRWVNEGLTSGNSDDEYANPKRFREITVAVERVLFATVSADRLLGSHEPITIRFVGDGTNTGGLVQGPNPVPEQGKYWGDPPLHYNLGDGPVAVGDHVLYLLGVRNWDNDQRIPQIDRSAPGSLDAWWPPGFVMEVHWVGNLREQPDGTVSNLDPSQTFASMDEATAQVLAAHDRATAALVPSASPSG